MTDYYSLGLEAGLLGDSEDYNLPNENMTNEEIEQYEQGYDEGIEQYEQGYDEGIGQYYENQENEDYDDEEFEIECFIDKNDNGDTIQ